MPGIHVFLYVREKMWMAGTSPAMTEFDKNASCSGEIPATGRGSGIPLNKQNSVFAGAVASIVEPPHRRPVLFGKSGKRRAYTPAAPGESLVELKQKTGP